MTDTVRIVCEEPSHADRPYLVATFERLDGTWFDTVRRVSFPLHGDDHGEYDLDGHRVRYRLDCRRCGLCVERRAEELHPKLDQLAAAGVPRVSLKALATVL